VDITKAAFTTQGGNNMLPWSSPIALAALTQYYLSVKPTTTNNVTVYALDVDDSNQLALHPGGGNFNYSTRVDGGAWAAPTTTRRLVAGLMISALDNGSGGSSPEPSFLG
jgi:hypothetical protein